MESESIDCCITSPPYYALRDYKVEGQLGLEKTFQEYLDKLIQIFSQVKRVLKKTGTCWVVMGDSYSGMKSGNTNGSTGSMTVKRGLGEHESNLRKLKQNISDKSLLMIPSRFAIQMIDSGWILRNDLIWHKPNCMPSSATDRFTVDYEHIFFFVKSKQYNFTTQYEPFVEGSDVEYRKKLRAGKQYNSKEPYKKNTPYSSGKCEKYYFKTQYEPHQDNFRSNYEEWANKIVNKPNDLKNTHYGVRFRPHKRSPNGLNRIKRTVWKISTKPFKDAHFAVFPEELVKACIEPGCPPNGITLDPFLGSGTVYKVALQTNRKCIGIELNPDYIEIARKRISPYLQQTKLLFNP